MGKSKGGNAPTTSKKAPDITSQKIKKARRCLQSGGKRGLDAFLVKNSDIRQNKIVQGLVAKAATLKVKPPKGKRAPARRDGGEID